LGKRVVISCWGSHGDLFPYVGLALALKRRGHSPVVATSVGYRPEIEREGIGFAEAGPPIDTSAPNAPELYERVMDPRKGSEVIVTELLMPSRETHEQLRVAIEGADLLVRLDHPRRADRRRAGARRGSRRCSRRRRFPAATRPSCHGAAPERRSAHRPGSRIPS
jgi:hypothetical protein